MIKGEVEYDVVDLIWTGQLIIHLINFNVFFIHNIGWMQLNDTKN